MEKTLLSPLNDLGKLDKNQLVKIQGSDLFKKKKLFIWQHLVSVAACGGFSVAHKFFIAAHGI